MNGNTYKVYYKTRDTKDSETVEILAEFACDKDRYMYEIEKAIKNRLSFTASDSGCCNDTGGSDYWVAIYIWQHARGIASAISRSGGADEILESLMRALSDDELDDNAKFIARMLDFDFESE